jgi:hypothetical protein
VLLGAGPAPAQDEASPILTFETESEIELDLAMMVDDVLPLLMDAAAVEGEENAASMQMVLDLVGVEALDRLRLKVRAREDHGRSEFTLTLGPEAADAFLPRLLAIEDRESRFARHLDRDQVVTCSVLHDLRAHLDLVLDMLARPDVTAMLGDMMVDVSGEFTIQGITPRTDLLPLLDGELTVITLDAPAEPSQTAPMPLPLPLPVSMVVALGSTDGHELRDRLAEMMDGVGGVSGGGIVDMMAALPADTVGSFEILAIPFGVAIAASQDFLVLGTSSALLAEVLADDDGDLDVPEGLAWSYVNGPKYAEMLAQVTTMAAMMSPADLQENLMTARMYDALLAHMDTQTQHVTSRPGRLTIENEVDGTLPTGLYRTAIRALEELPATLELEKQKREREAAIAPLRAIVGELDAAFIAHAEDHDGLYPADPHALVDGGYLESFPLERSVPPGEYAEGAYTYLPLHDDAGEIAGYFLFVYGGGEGTGYDVYTPQNVAAAEGDFVVGSDGVPDGVATSCYDGLAIEQWELRGGD